MDRKLFKEDIIAIGFLSFWGFHGIGKFCHVISKKKLVAHSKCK